MTSCGGTSMVTVLKSILTILSTNGRRIKSPGPLGPPCTRPRRKITPRSYSLTILMALSMTETTNIATITTKIAANPIPTACKSAKLIENAPLGVLRIQPNSTIGARISGRRKMPATGPARFSFGSRLEESLRPHVARDVVDRGPLGDDTRKHRGVDRGTVAHGDTDVGNYPAAILAPEEQVALDGCAGDPATVAHLRARVIRQGDPELLVDEHREAVAVLLLVGYALRGPAEHVRRIKVLLALGDDVAPGTADPAVTRRGSGRTWSGRTWRGRPGGERSWGGPAWSGRPWNGGGGSGRIWSGRARRPVPRRLP